MKISLRDLFWLTVIIAVAIAWWTDRQHIELMLESASRDTFTLYDTFAIRSPSGAAERREDLQAKLQKLSDQELTSALSHIKNHETFEQYLLEMSRRGMSEELGKIYAEAKQAPSFDPNIDPAIDHDSPEHVWHNSHLLTVLRRAEGKPDPMQISVHSIGKALGGRRFIHRTSFPASRMSMLKAGLATFPIVTAIPGAGMNAGALT